MIKKLYLVLIFITLAGLLSFGNTGEQEEIDFLLFMPNSGDQFVNEAQAMIQLDNLANYLKTRSISPGSISVHGYTAAAANDIDPVKLSRDRALHVINELKKRGLGRELFAEPSANGSVDLWGGNSNEGERSLNRRVMIVLDHTILNPSSMRTICTWEGTPGTNLPDKNQLKNAAEKTDPQCPWWIIPLALIGIALIAAIIFFAVRRKGNSAKVIPDASAAVTPARIPCQRIYIITEEEIRHYAYELYQLRKGQNEDELEDWHQSINELTAHYKALGYWVMLYWEV